MAVATMTRKERYIATLMGKKPDKLPLTVSSHDAYARFCYGVSARQFVEDPEASARATIRFVQDFNLCAANPGTAYIMFGCGPEVGVKWEFAGETLPAAVDGPIKTRKDLERWQGPTQPTGYFKNYLEICRIVRDEIGDQVFLNALVCSPFTMQCFMRGIDETMLDTKLDMDFYKAGMTEWVKHSKFLAEHVLALGLPNTLLVDVFLVPELIPPPFYHNHIAPYNTQVMQHFAARGQRISDGLAPFMGRKDDLVSQREGKDVYYYIFGTKEDLETIKIGMKYALPGFPTFVSLSGRMMSTWPKEDILDFLKRALDYMVGEKGKYPCIYPRDALAMSKEAAADIADKLRAINKFIDDLRL